MPGPLLSCDYKGRENPVGRAAELGVGERERGSRGVREGEGGVTSGKHCFSLQLCVRRVESWGEKMRLVPQHKGRLC